MTEAIPPYSGLGDPSFRTQARDLYREGMAIDDIAQELVQTDEQIRQWIWGKPRKPLNRSKSTKPTKSRSTLKQGKGFSVSKAQRERVKDKACLVCRRGPCDPAHLVPRSVAPDLDGDPRRVIPLCRTCHREYDEHKLSLLRLLEPHYREELAYAVECAGLLTTLYYVTGDYYTPAPDIPEEFFTEEPEPSEGGIPF